MSNPQLGGGWAQTELQRSDRRLVTPTGVLMPVTTAFCVAVGVILGRVQTGIGSDLLRPLLAAFALSLLVGVLASLTRQASGLVSVFGVLWLIRPQSPDAVGIALVLGLLIAHRLWRGWFLDVRRPVFAGAIVFLSLAVARLVFLLPWPPPVQAFSGEETPVYLVLLDGYPRADTLDELGIDISPFIEQLQERGFEHYANATSHHSWTYRTLTFMFTGEPMSADDFGSAEERLAARQEWQLPDDFVTIAPPWASLSIPGTPILNGGGFSGLEETLIRDSLFSPLFADYVTDSLRHELNRGLDLLTTTEAPRVFAHLLAPHPPFLYDASSSPTGSAPACWPECPILEIRLDAMGMTMDEWTESMSGYVTWLNQRLIETTDAVLARQPAAEIVLFSDHGARFDWEDREEWHKTFLAARTPSQPGLFRDSPHPSRVLDVVQGS